MDTPLEEKRNCRGLFETKYRYIIGTTEFYQCPVSIYGFDPEVIQVIDLILTSLESGIPVSGNCLLDQTKAFFEFNRIINDEKRQCHEELDKLREADAKKEEMKNKRASGKGRRR